MTEHLVVDLASLGGDFFGEGSGAPDIPPLSRALVIGVGGSGIQTITRVRSAIAQQRPDAAARSSIEFLGIDSVGMEKQVPILPNASKLGASEFYNLTDREFNPGAFIRRVGSNSKALAEWWDFQHSVPEGPLTDGLKQSRMLGRLAYFHESQTLASRIEGSMRRALGVDATGMATGNPGSPNSAAKIPVFLVSSSCGGTGSSGTLEVLHKIWVAARKLGTVPEVRLFTYLPGVFYSAIGASAAVQRETSNLNANAFAYFRELDHFIDHSDQLDRLVCNPLAGQNAEIPRGELVKQVFAVDNALGSQGKLSRVTDAFAIVAEGIFQFLMTDAGMPQIAQSGTNTDVFLTGRDMHDKRTVYCGIGVAAVTYPGETLRQHLALRFAEWLLREQLLLVDVDRPAKVRAHPETAGLVADLLELHGSVASFELPPDVREFQAVFETAPESLRDDQSDEVVTRVTTAFTNASPRAVGAFQAQARIAKDMATSQVDERVISRVLATGEGVPFGIEMIKNAEREIQRQVEVVEGDKRSNQQAVPQLEQETARARKDLRALNERFLVMPGSREKAGEELGRAIQAWGAAILAQHRATAEVQFLTAAVGRLAEMRSELETAERRLQRRANDFYDGWHADTLLGKDAGPTDTTALVPSDMQPDVEDSGLAKQAYKEIQRGLESENLTELTRDLYKRWRTNAEGRAIFGLGSSNPDEAAKAESALMAELGMLVNRFVLQTGSMAGSADPDKTPAKLIVPRSLREAANREDGGESLHRALTSLAQVHRSAAWAWQMDRLGAVEAAPSPSVTIIRPREIADVVAQYFTNGTGVAILDSPDPERIIVLTTEWGVSAHAITSVSSWEADYERALAQVHEDPTRKRPHLNKEWGEALAPLIPGYYDKRRAAEVIVRAELVSTLLTNQELADRLIGTNRTSGSDAPVLQGVARGSKIEYQGTSYVFDQGARRWKRSQDYALGTSYAEVLDAVGTRPDYQQSVDRFSEAGIEAVGRTKAAQIASKLLTARFQPLREKLNQSDPDFEVVDMLCAALAALRDDLTTSNLQTGVVSFD